MMKVSTDQIQRLDAKEGNEVEVCYVKNGTESVWYKAIIGETPPTKLKSTQLRQINFRLLKDESATTPFKQLSGNALVRPVPRSSLQARIEIKEGCVVDAYHKNGWWVGLVIKEENGKCLVYFDSPPDVIQFQRKHLRPQLDWCHKKWWVVPQPNLQFVRRLTEESMFSSGTMVEVSSMADKGEGVWVPAMVIKEIVMDDDGDDEKKCIVKFCNKPPSCKGSSSSKANVTVDLKSIRPRPAHSLPGGYKVSDCVEAFNESKWRVGILKRMVSPKSCMVYFKAIKKQFKFYFSDVRRPMEWEDGVWKIIFSPLAVGSVTVTMIDDSTSLENDSETLGMTLEQIKKQNCLTNKSPLAQDSVKIENEAISPVTPAPIISPTPWKQKEAETFQTVKKQKCLVNSSTQEKGKPETEAPSVNESVSHVTPSPSTPLKQTQGNTLAKKTLETTKNQKCTVNTSTQDKSKPEKETPSDGKRHKSMAFENINVQTKKQIPVNETVSHVTPVIKATPLKQTQGKTPQPVSNCSTRENAKKNSEDNNRKRKREEETTIVLPFEKKLSMWKTIESMEVFKKLPQTPHFSPLSETREASREMSAVGMMLTFSRLLQEIKDFKLCDPKSTFGSISDSFAELEKHGFDVKAPQLRIRKLLSLKDRQGKKMEDLEGIEKVIAVKERKKDEIEEKILEMQREKEEVEKEIDDLKNGVVMVGKELEDGEVQSQSIVSAHW